MTHLSVNVNKLATLRNSRGKNLPDVSQWARRILGFGAFGITVHPRPDGRHIRLSDVWSLRNLIEEWNKAAAVKAEFNIEGYPEDGFLELMEQVRPDQCTLVPDPPEALTSDAGWNLAQNEVLLTGLIRRLRRAGVRSSVFIDPKTMTDQQVAALRRIHPDRIELYTEAYHDHFGKDDHEDVLAGYRRVAEIARADGIGVNAGHDLNQKNLGLLIEAIPWIDEVSIGHALICEALEQGMEATVKAYLDILKRT